MKVNRRKFVSNTAAATTGLLLNNSLMGYLSKEESSTSKTVVKNRNLMEEVMKYRKIDSHAHVYLGITPDQVLYYADKLKIDRLMISRPITTNREAPPDKFKEVNDQIIQCMKQHPNRFTGMVVFNANYQKESLEEIDRCVDAGMVGTGELYRQVKINDPVYYPIIEKFIDLKMLIMQHSIGIATYTSVKRYPSGEPVTGSLPEDFVDIAKRYPEAMFQYAHIGGGIDWEYACKALQNSPNVYVEVSGSNNVAGMIDFAMKYIGEDRLLFGCDSSFYQGVGQMLSAKLTESQRRKIFFENYNNILKKSGNHVDR